MADPWKPLGYEQDAFADVFSPVGLYPYDFLPLIPEPEDVPDLPEMPVYDGYLNDAGAVFAGNPIIDNILALVNENGMDLISATNQVYNDFKDDPNFKDAFPQATVSDFNQIGMPNTAPDTRISPAELADIAVQVQSGAAREAGDRALFEQELAAYEDEVARIGELQAANDAYYNGSSEYEAMGSPGYDELAEMLGMRDPWSFVRELGTGGEEFAVPKQEEYRRLLERAALDELAPPEPTVGRGGMDRGRGGPRTREEGWVNEDAPYADFTAETRGRLGPELRAELDGARRQEVPDYARNANRYGGERSRLSAQPVFQEMLDSEADRSYRIAQVADNRIARQLERLQGNYVPSGLEQNNAMKAQLALQMYGNTPIPDAARAMLQSAASSQFTPVAQQGTGRISPMLNPSKYKSGPSTAAAEIERLRRSSRG